MSNEDPRNVTSAKAGLCSTCLHLRHQQTKRGTTYFRCARSDQDDRYLRYPPIPVYACDGFEALEPA